MRVASTAMFVGVMAIAQGGVCGRAEAADAATCERAKAAPARDKSGPTISDAKFNGCGNEGECGSTGRVCTWTFTASGKNLPKAKHEAYKKTFLLLPGGTAVSPFDNAEPVGATYMVRGCFKQARDRVESAVVLKNNDGKRSNALCLDGALAPQAAAASGATGPAPSTPQPAPAPPKATLPSDAEQQKALILKAFSEGVGDYIVKFPSAVADAYQNGTLSNINESLKAFFKYGKLTGEGNNLERGCLAMQGATMAAVAPVVSRAESLWVAKPIVVGRVMEHHAVALFRKGTAMEQGFVLDPWVSQTNDVAKAFFTWDAWRGRMRGLSLLGSPRLDE